MGLYTHLVSGVLFPLHQRREGPLIEIRQTDELADWFERLRDQQAWARIDVRIRRLSLSNPGDVKPVGEGVSELRINYGPGYRVYFVRRGDVLVVLLVGGDNRIQAQDIQRAIQLARSIREQIDEQT